MDAGPRGAWGLAVSLELQEPCLWGDGEAGLLWGGEGAAGGMGACWTK